MGKVNFTSERVAAFHCESSKQQSILWDAKTPGLGLRATSSGAKSYIFEARLHGKTLRQTIGDIRTWTISKAQSEATRLKALTDQGIDPRQLQAEAIAKDNAQRGAHALDKARKKLLARTAWDAYLAYSRPVTGKKSWGAQHKTDHIIAANPGGEACKIGNKTTKAGPLAHLLSMSLYAITSSVIQEWLALECESRSTFAHNSFRKFRTFIRWCTTQSDYKDVVNADCCLTDAVKDIVPESKTKLGDCLQREQLSAWFEAVRKINNPVISAYLQGLLITGARREELAGLRWVDADFRWRSLTIRDKVEGTREIPLTPYLKLLLSALPRRNEWVFSSPAAADGKLSEPRIAHIKALEAAALPHVSLHGLRRSFGTLCEWVEMPAGISAQIMGHKPSALAEKHYRRRPLDLLRMWHDKVEVWILEQARIEFVPAKPSLRAVK
jgi:hypothetical protein